MEWLSKQTKRLLLEISVGVVLYNLICVVAAYFLMLHLGKPALPVLLGLLAGMVCAIVMLAHMGVNTERALESRSEAYANKNTVLQSMLRKLVYVAVVVVLWRVLEFDLLAIVVGTIGMKAGAYLQPLVHRIFERNSKVS